MALTASVLLLAVVEMVRLPNAPVLSLMRVTTSGVLADVDAVISRVAPWLLIAVARDVATWLFVERAV
jgi:hypothetical protein